VRHWRDVTDGQHFDTGILQCADRCFTSGARTFYQNVNFAEAHIERLASGILSRRLRGEWRVLSRTLEAHLSGGCPRERIAGLVGQRDHNVIECSLNVGYSMGFRLDLFLLLCPCCCCFCHLRVLSAEC